MTDKKATYDEKISELKRLLYEAREETRYYQWLTVEAGKRSVREIDQLSLIYAEQKATDDKLKYRLDLEKLINTISARFLEIPSADINTGIAWTLQKIGEFYEVDRSYVVRFYDNMKKAEATHEWCAEGISPQIENSKNLSTEVCPWLMDMFYRHEPLYLHRVTDLEDEILKKYFQEQDIRSIICVPLYYGDNLIGALGFDSVKTVRIWNDEDILMIKTMADILVNAMERKRIEEERHKLEEQLRIRQRIDSLGTLAGGIAHDINNLLVVIMGNVDLIRMDAKTLTVKQREFIEKAYQSCQRAANLIMEIQTFSKGNVCEKTSLDLYPIAEEVFGILERATDKFIKKVIDFRPGQFYVYANSDQIHQVFFNLGTNSIQAIEERGAIPGDYIRISVEEYTFDKHDKSALNDGQYIHILFEDNGKGMSHEVKSRAFDPLFTTRRGAQKGQGLGLAMVYNIVTNNHDGYIYIETTEGKGTTFHIYLPKADPAEINDNKETSDTAGGSETILIIEDDQAVSEFVSDTLKKYGYIVITAVNGEEGLNIFEQQKDSLDLVLLDLTMPGISGEAVIKRGSSE